MIISHRGKNNHQFKENTIKALKESLNKSYIDGAELDIRITKDNKLVLHHGLIHNGKIIKYTNSKELHLEYLKDLIHDLNTNKLLIIEIKDNDIKIIDILYKIIKKSKNNIYIHSFHKEILLIFKQKYPKYKIGIISFNNNLNLNKFDFISLYYKNYRHQNKLTFVWTVNNKEKILNFLDKNISIITDDAYKIN